MSRSATNVPVAAWVLHHRAYRDSSLIVELFTPQSGRVGAVARGARRGGSALRALLQPFTPLSVTLVGRGELKTLSAAEADGAAVDLRGEALLAGFYLNELLLRLLARDDDHEPLWHAYGSTLRALSEGGSAVAPPLRRFERLLLDHLGYGLNLSHEAVTNAPLVPGRRYEYLLEEGPRALAGGAAGGGLCFSGAQLLAMHAGDYGDAATRAAARRLFGAALDLYLGGRPLRSRQVLASLRRLQAGPAPDAKVADED